MDARIHRVFRSVVVALLIAFGAHHRVAAQAPCENSDRPCPPRADQETARGLALGTGGRATAVSTSALVYHPASLAFTKLRLYHIEGQVDYMPAFKTVALGAAVADSATSKIGAGLSLRGFLSGEGGYDGLDGKLGLAFPFSDVFSIGLSGRYIDLSREEIAADDSTTEVELAHGFTLDASLRLTPVDGLQIMVAGYNFVDMDSAYAPILVAGAIGINIGTDLVVGVDVLTDMTSFGTPQPVFGGGIEYIGGQVVPVRLGYSFDKGRSLHTVSGGLGYVDKLIGLDVSLSQEVDGGNETRIMAAMRYFVQ